MADRDARREPHPSSAEAVGRHGERTAGAGASFLCGACAEVAAVIKLLRAGTEADMGPPLGRQRQRADGVIIDYWLSSTCWMAVNTERWGPHRGRAHRPAPRPRRAAMPSTGSSRRFGAASARPATAATTGAAPFIFDGPTTAPARPGQASCEPTSTRP
jgi:hypothetical protein